MQLQLIVQIAFFVIKPDHHHPMCTACPVSTKNDGMVLVDLLFNKIANGNSRFTANLGFQFSSAVQTLALGDRW